MTNFLPAKLSPHNCTVCGFFENVEFLSDTEQVNHWADVVWVTCRLKGKFTDSNLYICRDFEFDEAKPVIVQLIQKTHMFRDYRRVYSHSEEFGLEGRIYDLVCKIHNEHGLKSWLKFVIERIHRDTGVERQSIWRCVMSMIESGYLVREELQGQVVVSPPSAVLSIAEVRRIGKGKVSV
ncbi:hypothetical protein [Candidatus Methanoperedens nitratireducens]|uniref:Uncharacterized protein n=1 Tax=Candidatus Methanoperedens nitratireducens TaxID=1392998 RepID=A0A284VNS5_9EURY|nr:hypothetical protein [Candidatus Methanoperedens nitroreducens]SNQ60863.1 hypothetical protein MNV_2060005 [Candidatus Methanoperedens nitroreducens]